MLQRAMKVAAIAATLPVCAVSAQTTIFVPTGNNRTAPVPQSPPTDPRDTPEEIAKDSARDLKDSRFYNKPGATRADYDRDWQTCRLIARGSRTPSGSTTLYVPAGASVAAAGIGGGIGAAIGSAIAEGRQRRANRQQCLLIKGWRLVELDPTETARIAALSEQRRNDYFNTIVGAQKVNGHITERKSFTLAPDPEIHLDAPFNGPTGVVTGAKGPASGPFTLAPGEAAIVLAFRRPDGASAGRTGRITLARYDLAARDVLYRPRDWKKRQDRTIYDVEIQSRNKKAGYEVQVIRVTPGDYVVSGVSSGAVNITQAFCFGAPVIHVEPGEVTYAGDFIPYFNLKLSTGDRLSTLAWTSHLDDAKRILAASDPSLGGQLKQAVVHNKATYGCAAITMDRWDLPGVEDLPDPMPPAADVATQKRGS